MFTKPGREATVEGRAAGEGVRVFLPRCAAGRPLFPRYLFAEECPDPVSLRYLPGVSDLVRSPGSGGRFVRVADEVVEELRSRDGVDLSPPPPPPLRPGEPVVIHGMIRAKLVALRSEERALVMLNILGGTRHSVVSLADLQRAVP